MGSQCDAAVSILPLHAQSHTHTHTQAERSTCKLLATCGLRPQGRDEHSPQPFSFNPRPSSLALHLNDGRVVRCPPCASTSPQRRPARPSCAVRAVAAWPCWHMLAVYQNSTWVISCMSALVSWWHAITGTHQICAVQPGQPTIFCIASKVEASTSQSKSSDSRCQGHHDDVG